MINPEYIHYVVDSGLIVMLWKGNRALNRWLDVLTEYPPHRHLNGKVSYPKGMEPGLVEQLDGANHR